MAAVNKKNYAKNITHVYVHLYYASIDKGPTGLYHNEGKTV
jgi:hypothetical protein